MTAQERQWIDTLTQRVEAASRVETAQHVDSGPASVERCSALWIALVSGGLQIVQALAQEQQSVLILKARAVPVPPLGPRTHQILERTLLGESRKVIAYETNVSPSTVAFALKEALAGLGLRCRPSMVPSSLVILAHAACRGIPPTSSFISDGEHQDQHFTVFTHVFEDAVLRGLSPSERVVVRLLASGRSCGDIAARRNRSCRTVVNQVAAACRRLGVSGRLELLHRFATLAVSEPPQATNR
ncbi:MAG TPA: LuxR C-terminal-related transcriptional regulator [Polyangiaceae bacterium]|nr:LuxR C-terminal-related transcriptional regulator [Polyangiaceae bacterium]